MFDQLLLQQVQTDVLRSRWANALKFNYAFGLTLILAFGVPRFAIVLQANSGGNYSFVSLIFILMWLMPYLLLTREGRKKIGFLKPENYSWLILSFIIGVLASSLVYLLGEFLFADSFSNWFVYISNSYKLQAINLDQNRLIYFLIYSFIGMTFSPIGEELLYRGLIHGSFATQMTEQKASILDSLAFALTHLAHFGIVFVAGHWSFLFLPAAIWVMLMFLASRLFFICKVKSGSILGAILCHAGFNLAMTYYIIYFIL